MGRLGQYAILGVIVCVGIAIYLDNSTAEIESYSDLDTHELIQKYGYPAETHEVITDDGYILTLHRIPHSPKIAKSPNKPVVLMLHGAVACSADFVVLGPGKSEAFQHADAGYDIWLANFRGNIYSRRHVKLSPSSDEYWDFSFHEMGLYDAPAQIDYILNTTKQERLYIIGLSLGTTAFFVMASSRPEYNNKVHLMTAEAPVTIIRNNWNSILSTDSTVFFLGLMYNLGVRAYFQSTETFKTVGDTLCKNRFTRIVCLGLVYMLAGYDPDNLEMENLPVIISHLSGGVSTKTMEHICQMHRAEKFQQWDHGTENMIKYGQETPPEYNLSAISAPVAILYGPNDPLGQPQSAIWVHESIGNGVKLHRVPQDTFSHYGFVYGKNAKTLIFDTVSSLLSSH